MRIIGLDIHRAFAEAVAWDDGKLKRLGRVDMRRPLRGFRKEAFEGGRGRRRNDRKRGVGRSSDRAARQESRDRKPQAGARHRPCEDQDRYDRRQRPRPTLCERLSARSLDSGRADAGASPAGDPAQSDRPAAIALEEHHPADPAQPSDPLLPTTPICAGRAGGHGFFPRSCRRTNGLPSNGICASSIGSARTSRSSSVTLPVRR